MRRFEISFGAKSYIIKQVLLLCLSVIINLNRCLDGCRLQNAPSFGGSDLKLGGKRLEQSVRSEILLRVFEFRVLRVHVTTMDAHFTVITLID